MNELDFRLWLNENEYSKKVQSDTISRLKKLERELNYIDIDAEYKNDNCKFLMSVFINKGENNAMRKINPSSLPVGKYQLSTYKYSLNLYIKFIKSLS